MAALKTLVRKAGRLGGLFEKLVMGLAVLAVLGAIAFFTVPRVMGWQGVIVLTGSMEPALDVGGLAFIDKGVEAGEVKVGDIITYRAEDDGRQVTHRVVEVNRDSRGLWFKTRGDANEQDDVEPVRAASLVGRVVVHVPELGNISNWLRQKENLFIILWLPAGLIIAGEVANIYKNLRGQRETAS